MHDSQLKLDYLIRHTLTHHESRLVIFLSCFVTLNLRTQLLCHVLEVTQTIVHKTKGNFVQVVETLLLAQTENFQAICVL